MNVEKRAKIITDWKQLLRIFFKPKALVVGISGGLTLSSKHTLCFNKRRTIVLSMPKQIKEQHDPSIEHGKWLTGKFKNVEHKILELENLFINFEKY